MSDQENEDTTQNVENTEHTNDKEATDNSSETPASDVNVDGVNSDDDKSQSENADVSDDITPESYSDFTLPEDVKLDEAVLDRAKPMFAELGLNQEQAQKLVDFQAEMVKEGVLAQNESHSKQVETWHNEAKADKDFGGDKFDESIGIAKKAIDTYGDDSFRQMMDDTGLGNHPAMIRLMWNIGKTLQEDVPGSTGSAQNAPTDRVSQMYPTTK